MDEQEENAEPIMYNIEDGVQYLSDDHAERSSQSLIDAHDPRVDFSGYKWNPRMRRRLLRRDYEHMSRYENKRTPLLRNAT